MIKDKMTNEIEKLSLVKTLSTIPPYKPIDLPDSITPPNQNTLDFKENSLNSIVNPTSSKNNRIKRNKLQTKLFTSFNELLSKNIKSIRAIAMKCLT